MILVISIHAPWPRVETCGVNVLQRPAVSVKLEEVENDGKRDNVRETRDGETLA